MHGEFKRTLELDVTVHKPNLVHPPNRGGELAKHAPRKPLRHLRMPVGEKIEKLAAFTIVEDENGVDGRFEGRIERNEGWMVDGLLRQA